MRNDRLKKIQSAIKHPILVKKKENLFYLTGYSFDLRAEEYLLIKKHDAIGFGSGLEKIIWAKKTDQLRNIGKYLKGSKQLDIEYGFSYGEGMYLERKIKDLGLKIKVSPTRSAVDVARMIKDEQEIQLVRKSMQIVEKVFQLVRHEIKRPGMTEEKLAKFIMDSGRKFGAEDVSFPAIVASGANAAIPHHVPGNKRLKAGESIIIDFGFKYKQYCSDFTRTVFLKFAPERLAEAYRQTEKAYNESMDYISRSANPTGDGAYEKSVEVLEEKKLDKYFIHSLGHGTGLEIHELPNLSPKSKDILTDGMIFSIEPGAYFPKLGGIRIEDLVYMEKGQCKKFINVSTKLEDNIL